MKYTTARKGVQCILSSFSTALRRQCYCFIWTLILVPQTHRCMQFYQKKSDGICNFLILKHNRHCRYHCRCDGNPLHDGAVLQNNSLHFMYIIVCSKNTNNVLDRQMYEIRSPVDFCKCGGRCSASGTVGIWSWKFEEAREVYCCAETTGSKTSIGKKISNSRQFSVTNRAESKSTCITDCEWFTKLCLDNAVSSWFLIVIHDCIYHDAATNWFRCFCNMLVSKISSRTVQSDKQCQDDHARYVMNLLTSTGTSTMYFLMNVFLTVTSVIWRLFHLSLTHLERNTVTVRESFFRAAWFAPYVLRSQMWRVHLQRGTERCSSTITLSTQIWN